MARNTGNPPLTELLTSKLRAIANRELDDRMLTPGEAQDILDTFDDAISALRYIEKRYGRLDGVGWERVLS